MGGEGSKAAGPLFHHTIKLKGAKSPENYFNIVVDPSIKGIILCSYLQSKCHCCEV